MERRGRGGEGCGKARGMYSLGNRKEGAGGWRGRGGGNAGEDVTVAGEVRGGAGEYEGKRGDVGKRGRARKKRRKM